MPRAGRRDDDRFIHKGTPRACGYRSARGVGVPSGALQPGHECDREALVDNHDTCAPERADTTTALQMGAKQAGGGERA